MRRCSLCSGIDTGEMNGCSSCGLAILDMDPDGVLFAARRHNQQRIRRIRDTFAASRAAREANRQRQVAAREQAKARAENARWEGMTWEAARELVDRLSAQYADHDSSITELRLPRKEWDLIAFALATRHAGPVGSAAFRAAVDRPFSLFGILLLPEEPEPVAESPGLLRVLPTIHAVA